MDACASCGEIAVTEEEVDGVPKLICTECGTVTENQLNYKKQIEIGQSLCDTEKPFCDLCNDDLGKECKSRCCDECEPFREELQLSYNQMDDNDEITCGNDDQNENTNVCKSCKGRNLHYVEIHMEKQIVCQDCGTMSTEIQIDDNVDFSGQFLTQKMRAKITNLPKYSSVRMRSKGLVCGTEKILLVCNKLELMTDIQKKSQELFEQAYHKFIMGSLSLKENMAIASVYIVARQENIPISLAHFNQFADNFRSFLKAKKRMVKALGLTISCNFSLSAEINQVIHSKGLDHLSSKVRDFLYLSRKAWLSQGTNTESLITLGVYYSFISSDQCKKYIGIEKFREKFELPPVSHLLFKNTNKFLIKLAKEIPWVNRERIHIRNFQKYFYDILEFQNNLIHFAFKSEESLFPNGLAGLAHRKRPAKGEELLPPSMLKKKKSKDDVPYLKTRIPPNIDLDSKELKETEFADEIDSYILSAEEQEQLAPLKMTAWE